MNEDHVRNVVEAALLAAGRPLSIVEIAQLFDEDVRPAPEALQE
jgi:chromosome segregation and condensation protein ScpB